MNKVQIFRLIDYLGTNPRINDLCNHLLNDFQLPYHPESIRVLWKGANNTLEVIGENGYEDDPHDSWGMSYGKVYDHAHWSQTISDGMEVLCGKADGQWSDSGQTLIFKLNHSHLTLGYVKLRFGELSQADRDNIDERIEITLAVLNLYILMEMQRIHTLAVAEGQKVATANAGLDAKTRFGLLSARQIKIMRFIGEQKTNAQIGSALGYATTTIHAECSEIYLLLAVGNRGQAYELVKEFLPN
jgi:DNA-binding CsgD family transcriptional regulator